MFDKVREGFFLGVGLVIGAVFVYVVAMSLFFLALGIVRSGQLLLGQW